MNILFEFCLGNNSGEAFGRLGIGVYGKKWLQRDKELRIEFKYRATQKQRVVQAVRISVPSLDQGQADDCIRQWLLQRQKFAKPKPKRTISATMFIQAVDKDVIQRS